MSTRARALSVLFTELAARGRHSTIMELPLTPLSRKLIGKFCVCSAEKGNVGSDGPSGDQDPPQHHRPEHPDQRRLRAHQPVDPGDQTAAGGQQAAEVGSGRDSRVFPAPPSHLLSVSGASTEKSSSCRWWRWGGTTLTSVSVGWCDCRFWAPVSLVSLHRGLRPGIPAGLQRAERRAAQDFGPHRQAARPQRAVVRQMLRSAVHLKAKQGRRPGTTSPRSSDFSVSFTDFLCFSCCRCWKCPVAVEAAGLDAPNDPPPDHAES